MHNRNVFEAASFGVLFVAVGIVTLVTVLYLIFGN